MIKIIEDPTRKGRALIEDTKEEATEDLTIEIKGGMLRIHIPISILTEVIKNETNKK